MLRILAVGLCVVGLTGCPISLSSGGDDSNVATSDSLKGSPLTAICQTRAKEIFVASGSGKILHSTDGISFEFLDPGTFELNAAFCDDGSSSATKVWFAGPDGTILYYDGVAIVAQASNVSVDLNALFGQSAGDIFAVGNGGGVTHWNGTVWTPQATSVDQPLFGVSGRSTEVLAVGAHKTMLRNLPPGTVWQDRSVDLPLTVDSSTQLNAIWIASNGEAFVVGNGGKILHRNSSLVWQEQNSGVELDLLAVSGTSASAVMAVGRQGTALIYDGNKWTQINTVEGGADFDLVGVLARSDQATFVVGNDGNDGIILGLTTVGLQKLL